MALYFAHLLGSKSDYLCKNKEYEAVYEVEGGKIMRKTPFISVIMPVYNSEEYLDTSIQSVLNQNFQNLELILVNDCSKDKSKEICQKYAEDDERVKFIDLPENIGAGKARNKGLEFVTGEYVTFVDADDKIDLELYQHAATATENGKIDMVVWGMTEFYLDKKGNLHSENIVQTEEGVWCEKEKISEKILELEAQTLFGYQCNKLYKYSIIEKYRIRFEKSILYEDYFFTLEFAKQINSLACIMSVGYFYYKRFNESITTRYVPEYFELSRRRVKEMYDFCCKQKIQSEDILGNIYLRYILSGAMRNEDKRSGLSGKDKICWFKKVRRDDVYRNIIGNAQISSPVLKILKFLMNHGAFRICRFMGVGTFLLKDKGPLLFARLKNN